MLHAWRLAARSWTRRPALAVAVVASLGLSIALGIAMSAILDTVRRQATVFPNGPELVRAMRLKIEQPQSDETLPAPAYAQWRAETKGFASIAAYQQVESVLDVGSGRRLRVHLARVSGNLFETLGVLPTMGRGLRIADEGVTPCASIVTQRLAARFFGDARASIDRSINIDGESCRIVGVVADRYAFPSAVADVFIPLNPGVMFTKDARGRISVSIAQVRIIGRPRQDFHRDMLITEASRYFEGPADVVSFGNALTASYRRTLEVLWLCSLVVLTVAVFNVSAVMATHAVTRLGEWGVKGALGASRRAIWAETVRESAVVCLFGTVVGFALAFEAVTVLRTHGPRELASATVSWQTSAVWLVLTVVLVGATSAPAWWQASKLAKLWLPAGDMRTAGAAVRSPATAFLGPVLLIAQLGCAVGLISVTLLFAATLHQTLFVERGFAADDVVMVPTYKTDGASSFADYARRVEAAARVLVASAPGTEVAIATDVPVPTAQRAFSMRAEDEAHGVVMHGDLGSARVAAVGPGYFRIMRIPVLAGREFMSGDTRAGQPVAIVSASLAHAWFGSPSAALGKTMRVSALDGLATVIGIAGNVRRSVWDTNELPVLYVPYAQLAERPAVASGGRDLLLLFKGWPVSKRPDSVLALIERGAPELQVGPPRSVLRARLQEAEQSATYLGVAAVFTAVTVLLVALGVFGATSHLVARRSGELAIRQALGATPREARRTIVMTVLKWWLIAVVVGVFTSATGAKIVSVWQAGLAPMTIWIVAYSLLVASVTLVLAAWLPLRQASRVEPALLMRRA